MATTTARTGSDDGFVTLVEQAAQGDGDAFGALVAPLLPGLAGYLRAQVGDDADDVVNEVLLAAFDALPRFHGDAAGLRAWVFTIARHRVIDLRRRRRPVPVADADDRAGGDVEDEAVSRLLAAEVLAVLERLAPLQRQVLLLRVVADLTVEETATVLGKRPGAIRVLQHRAIASVRKKIRREV